MKKQLTALSLVCALLLTALAACSNGGEPSAPPEQASTENVFVPSETVTETSAAASGPVVKILTKEEYPDFIYGPYGDVISKDDVAELQSFDRTDRKWDAAICDGFTYLAEPTGISFNSEENADLFDSEKLAFKDVPESPAPEFKRYRAGDSVCGLTVREASIEFSENAFRENKNEGYHIRGYAAFDGTASLTGWLIVLGEEEYGYGERGSVRFILDNESQVLPIMNYDSPFSENDLYSEISSYCRIASGIAWQNEYPYIRCGSVDDYEPEMFSGIDYDTPVKAKITADEIVMNTNMDWGPRITVKITDMETVK